MKLLSPTQVRDTKALEQKREVLRSAEISKFADETRKKMSLADADFKLMLAGQKDRWAREEQEHLKRVSEMTSEIRVLENQREKALEPIELLKERAEIALKQALGQLEEVKVRECEVDDNQERLEAKLSEVGGRETDVVLAETKIKLGQEGLAQQKESIIVQSIGLSEAISKFRLDKEESDKKIDKRQTELFLAEQSLVAKDEKLKRDREALEVWEKQLKDERGTLERAFARISPQTAKNKSGKM